MQSGSEVTAKNVNWKAVLWGSISPLGETLGKMFIWTNRIIL